MTIIHISGSLGGGGAEQMVLQLASKSHNSIKTKVFALADLNELENEYAKMSIDYNFLHVNSFKNKSLLNGLKLLRSNIKNDKDIIFHCHQFHSVLIALIYNLRYKAKPIVFTLHSSVLKSFSRKLILLLTKPFRDADIIFSKNAKNWFLKNSIVIPNGIDFKKFHNEESKNYSKQDVFEYLYVGRLSSEKNPLALIDFAIELKRNTNSKFIINVLGSGELHDKFKELIKLNHLEQTIFLRGFTTDILPYFKKAHCFLLPSHWEGMPVVLIEAAATKLPILSTPVGSIPDFLNKTNATVCSLVDFPSNMLHIMDNYELSYQKSKILYSELKEHFDINNVYKKHLELYKSLIN
jgi:glycosyltransferase involved in cell wall biosynthesis